MPALNREQQYQNQLRETLRRYIFASGHTVTEFAEYAGMSPRTLYERLKHPQQLSLFELNAIARAAHIPSQELLSCVIWAVQPPARIKQGSSVEIISTLLSALNLQGPMQDAVVDLLSGQSA